MKLTADAVNELMKQCLSRPNENHNVTTSLDGVLVVHGLVQSFSFHPGRIAEHADEIEALLKELPDEFQRSGGGGWSFLNACNDRHGNLWTGLHQTMECLFCLGIAAGKANWVFPREHWNMLPGGVPYVVVH